MSHDHPIGELMTAELHFDFELFIDRKFFRTEKREDLLVQFVDEGVSGTFSCRAFGSADFQCDSFQATVSHEKVGDAARASGDYLFHPFLSLREAQRSVNNVSGLTCL